MEFNYVQQATISPTVCAFCKTHEGPFLDTHLEGMTIATASGVVDFQGHIYVCSTKYREDGEMIRSGCAEQMAFLGKHAIPREKLLRVEEICQAQTTRIEELEELLKNKKVNLTLADVEELVRT